MDKNKFNLNLGKKHRDRQRQLYLDIAFFGVFACVALIFLLLAFDKIPAIKPHTRQNKVSTEASTETASTETAAPKDTLAAETSITISLMGDCTLGTDEYFDANTSLNAYYSLYGSDYFFQNVKSYLEKDDLSIVNFEGTLTTSETRADKEYAFKADPEYASILTSGSVEAANLANNHSSDYGAQSYTDTQNALKNAGITTFGNDETAVIDIKGIKVGLVGIYELDTHLECRTQLVTNINKVKEEGANLIIVNFHWGNEKETTPDSNQTTLARAAIDAGADLVVGHHPHVLQGMDVYNGRTIFYSLGNFCFGGNTYPSDFDTVIFQPTFTFNTSKELTSTTNTIIPCSLSSESSYNNYQPTPVEGSEKTRIEQKINDLTSQISNTSGTTSSYTTTDSLTGTSDTSANGDTYNSTADSSGTSNNTSDSTGSSEGTSDSSSSDSTSDTSGDSSVKLFLPD